jgi:hypothetical protein
MGQRINVLWGILVSLLVLTMVWIGYGNYRLSKKVETLKQTKIILGTDEQLKETVNTLEKSLNERLAYRTKVESDPFDLTKVIQSRKFLNSLGLRETLEQQGRMRLAATVVGDSPSAIIKFMGQSKIVHEGDMINGFTVERITQQQCQLRKAGAVLTLVNEAAPEGEFTDKQSSVSAPGGGNN